VKVEEIIKRDYDLSARNPNRILTKKNISPDILIKRISKKEKEIQKLLSKIYSNLNKR